MTATKEMRSLQAREMRVAKADDGTRTISGIVNYNSMSLDLGGFSELIAPGAFGDIISGDVLCLRDHSPILLMGRTKSKTLILKDTADGLEFKCSLPNTTSASDLAESIDRGDLDGVSFGFYCTEDNWIADKDGAMIRTIVSAELLEVSPCSFAAYPANSVSVRSCPKELRSKLAKPDKACECDCPECADSSCDSCSDDSCDDPNCACREQRGLAAITNAEQREYLAMRLKLADRQ